MVCSVVVCFLFVYLCIYIYIYIQFCSYFTGRVLESAVSDTADDVALKRWHGVRDRSYSADVAGRCGNGGEIVALKFWRKVYGE